MRRPPAPPPRARQPQPQRIVVIEQRLQRRNQIRLAQPAGTCSSIAWLKRSSGPPRSSSQRMIGVAGNRASRMPGSAARRRRSRLRRRRQRRHRLVLEHLPRRDHQPARRARLTSWIDMMLSPPSAKKLSSMPTRSTPSTSANSAHSTSSAACAAPRNACSRHRLRRRQRPPVELAVRRQRQPLQHHERRRHHVVRQPLAPACARSAAASGAPRRRPPPHRPPAACSPGPSSRATTAACATAGMPRQRRLDLAQARCGSRAASPAASARPRNSSTPSARQRARSPVRYIRLAAAPITGRPRTAPPSAPAGPDSRAPAPPRDVQLPRQPQPAPAPARRPARRPACSRSAGRSGRCRRTIARPRADASQPTVVSVGPYTLIEPASVAQSAPVRRSSPTAAPRRRRRCSAQRPQRLRQRRLIQTAPQMGRRAA